MKLITKIFLCGLIPLVFTGCFGEKKVKLKKSYTDVAALKQDIVNAVSEQYGMQFEIGKGLGGHDATIGVRGRDFGFYGYLRPANIPESYKKYNVYTNYTVCNETGTFKTQAHVRMFEEQLKTDIDKIFDEIGMKYDIIEFRGMDRNINKWSKDSSYGEYKVSKDYETWIYIKLPPQKRHDCDYDYNRKYYAPIILPQVKKLYSALEPEYNVTLIFYLDEYHDRFYLEYEKKLYVHDSKNAEVVWLDLSKFKNYLDWTEYDIEVEVGTLYEDSFITAWKKANGIE